MVIEAHFEDPLDLNAANLNLTVGSYVNTLFIAIYFLLSDH
jgi:hypothetical protein